MSRQVYSVLLRALLAAWVLASSSEAAELDKKVHLFFQAEEFEYRLNDGADTFYWEAQGWLGGDTNKAWLKTRGEQVINGALEQAEIQLLYSRNVADFWDFQVGVRHDFEPQPNRTFGAIGFHGLAPYFFEVDTAMFVSEKGEVSARLEGEYELLLTQRLILQPKFETNLAVQEVRERGIGSGFNDVELGLRLRYEITRKFAPYIGVSWEKALGQTADFVRGEGGDTSVVSFVGGIRFWF